MFVNSVILLALTCVTRASVIINSYEDGENKVTHPFHDLSDCNNSACDRLCRRLGFQGGTCVGDRCKCDNFASLTDTTAHLYSCTFFTCNQKCRALGFKGGVCLEEKCKCGYFEPTAEFSTDYPLSASCTDSVCNKLCLRLGFKGGSCFQHRCQCEHFTKVAGKKVKSLGFMGEREVTQTVGDSCDSGACDQICRRLGFPGGICREDTCYCLSSQEDQGSEYESNEIDDSQKEEDLSPSISLKDELQEINTVEICNSINCYFMCRAMNYMGGNCFNGACMCY